MAGSYAHPEVLVDTAWVYEHLSDPQVRLLEVDVDTSAYDAGHIPGAVGLHWKRDLETPVARDRRLVAAQVLWARRRAHHERRTQEVDGRGTTDDQGRTSPQAHRLQDQGTRSLHPRRARRGARRGTNEIRGTGGRALPQGVLGRAAGARGAAAGRRATRRARARRRQHSLGRKRPG